MPKISVLVPVYNTGKFLVQCLESLKNQTMEDVEFICINDGSTDNSLDILTSFANDDDRFKIITKNNSGYGHTMNVGIENAVGDYIGIVESDDFTEPEMYQKLYETAKSYNADLVKSNYWTYIGGRDRFEKPLENGPYRKVFTPRIEEKRVFLRGQSIWSSIYRRELIQKNGVKFLETPGASYQDTSFYFITMALADRVVLLEDAFLHYRQDNPYSSVKSTGKIFCVCDEFKAIWDFLETKPELKECLKYILSEFQWNVYQWNMSRLEERYKYDFLERLYDEFKKMDDMNLLKKECWNNQTAFNKMNKIKNGKEKFLYEYYLSEQIDRIQKNAFLNEINKYSDVYVYGAGVIGKNVIGLLEKNRIQLKAAVVTHPENNHSEVLGYSVLGIDEMSDKERADSLFMIAVKEATQYSIIRSLQKKGVKNIIAVSNELRRILIS